MKEILSAEQLNTLAGSALFAGITSEQLPGLLTCLGGGLASYSKGEVLLANGQPVTRLGVVLAGAVQVAREDAGGERVLVATLTPGDLFGEALVCAGVKVSPVTLEAAADSTIYRLPPERLSTPCSAACAHHTRLIQNLLRVLAGKTLLLQDKIDVLSRRRIRDKLLAFLAIQARRAGRQSFAVPYTREQLAEALGVNRSALSRELSAMQAEGLVTFEKNRFTLLTPP